MSQTLPVTDPTGSAPPTPALPSRACRFASSRRSGAPATPGRSGCRNRPPGDGWRSSAEASPHTTHELSPTTKIAYRHHPHYGAEVKRVRTLRRFLEAIDIVQLPQGFQIAVPHWMLDPVVCSQLPQEAKPRVALSVLLRLAQLVQSRRLPHRADTAPLDTSPPTKGQHVSEPTLHLSTSSIAAAEEDALASTTRSHARPLSSGAHPVAAAGRPEGLQGKEPR